MDIDTLNQHIEVLSGIVSNSKPYQALWAQIQINKNKHGAIFKSLTLDGVPKLYAVQSTVPVMLSDKNIESPFKFQELLNLITYDFSILSAMTTTQWVNLAQHLYDAGIRTISPEDRTSSSDTDEGAIMVKMYTQYPWILTLLLLEVMYPIIEIKS